MGIFLSKILLTVKTAILMVSQNWNGELGVKNKTKNNLFIQQSYATLAHAQIVR